MDLYESTQYNHSSENKTILLDISGNTTTTFSKELTSKLILDEEYEIYFESITTFKTKVNTGLNDVSFLLKFDDLNIQIANNTTNQNLSANKILIPNNCNTNGGTSVSKSKKMNFICSILPTNISKINFSLTNLNNETIFTTDDGRSIIELLCIPKNKKKSEKGKIDIDLYENTRYLNNDNNKHLIIDLEGSGTTAPYTTNFSINLNEPLIINKKSEIYLDNIIFNNSNSNNDINNMGLLLDIKEFDINNGFNKGNNLDSNKILLPNENIINSNVTTNTYTENLSGLGDEIPGENVPASESGISGSFIMSPSSQVNLDFVGFNSDLFDTGTWSEDISNINGAFSDAASGSVPTGDGTGTYRSLDVEEYTNNARFTNFYSKSTENGTNSSTHYISLSGPSPRYVRTKSINDILSIASKVTIDYIIGDGSNGGSFVNDGDHFGINILSAINGSSRTQTPTDTSLYKKRVSSFTNTNNFNFLIETRGGRNSSDTDIYGHGSGYTDDGEFKRISFCPVGSSIATPSSDLSTTYPAVYELPGLGTADANYLEFISTGHSRYYDPYAVKFISIETSLTTNTYVNKTLKSKKYNYISTIRPKVIKNISGNITNLNNTTIVSSTNSRLIMDFLIKPCL